MNFIILTVRKTDSHTMEKNLLAAGNGTVSGAGQIMRQDFPICITIPILDLLKDFWTNAESSGVSSQNRAAEYSEISSLTGIAGDIP